MEDDAGAILPPARRRRKAETLFLPRRGELGRRIVKTVEEWPQLDREIWEAAQTPRSLLGGGRAGDWRRPSREACVQAYGLWLSFLDHLGELDPAVAPPARLTRERVHALVELMRETGHRETSIRTRLDKLAQMLDAMDPEGAGGRHWLRAFVHSLENAMSEGHAHELAFGIRVQDLWALGQRMMEEGDALAARPRARTGIRGAARFRDGLMIAVQALVLLRPRSLLALEAGISLVQDSDGLWGVSLAGGDTKNGHVHRCPLAGALGPSIDRYLAVHRSRLLARSSAEDATTALWVSDRGTALSPMGAWHAVAERVARELGVQVSLHRFRHVGASTVAVHAPGMMGVMPTVMGHRDIRPLQNHYDRGTELEAGRRYAESVGGFRREREAEEPRADDGSARADPPI